MVVDGLVWARAYKGLIPADARARDPRFRAFLTLLGRDWPWITSLGRSVKTRLLQQVLEIADSEAFVCAVSALSGRLGLGQLAPLFDRLQRCPAEQLREHKNALQRSAELVVVQVWQLFPNNAPGWYRPAMSVARAAQMIIRQISGSARHSVGPMAMKYIYLHAQAIYGE